METDIFEKALLEKLGPDKIIKEVKVIVEANAKKASCYYNVEEKIKSDGGKIHYGWVVWHSEYICEAEHHAVWENNNKDLIDVTPRESEFDRIFFVSDNSKVFLGKAIPSVRINKTENKIVNDFIAFCEIEDLIWSNGARIDSELIKLPKSAADTLKIVRTIRGKLVDFILKGSDINTNCFCGKKRLYRDCHGPEFEKRREEILAAY